MKYTYSDDEDDFLTDSTTRRSTRNTRNHTPADPAGSVVTASGRQIRAPTRLNIETVSNGAPSAPGSIQGDIQLDDVEMTEENWIGPTGRPRRSAAVHHGLNGWASKSMKNAEYDSDEDDVSEPDFGDDEEGEEHVPEESDEDEEEFEEDEVMDDDLDDTTQRRLVIKLPIKAAVDTDGRAKLIVGSAVHAETSRDSQPVQPDRINSDEPRPAGVPYFKASFANGLGPQPEPEPEPEEKSADVISVATKLTQQAPEPYMAKPSIEAVTTPRTPSRGPSASLAFGETSEKPQHVPRPIDVGGGE